MATQVQLRRGTTAENDAFTGAQGELTFDTNNKRVRVHDGGTAGGFEIKTEDGSGNTIFADNEKAIFGAGSDLQIFHDGSNSFIDDAGTGVLSIRSNSISLGKYTGENLASFVADGAVTLYHDNAAKFETTSLGVDITSSGNVAAAQIQGASHTAKISTDGAGTIFGATTNGYMLLTTNGAERLRIDNSGHLIAPNGITLGTAVGTYNADNTLDDYEEGTWTPASGGGSGPTGSGIYIKIGRSVTVMADVTFTGVTSPTHIITGLPFPANDVQTGACIAWNNSSRYLNLLAPTGGSNLSLGNQQSAIENVNDNNRLIFSVTYQT